MIGGPVGPADIGPLYHHGPELFPVVELIFGGGLPLAAALGLRRCLSIRDRLTGGAAQATESVLVEGDASDQPMVAHRSGPREKPGLHPSSTAALDKPDRGEERRQLAQPARRGLGSARRSE